MGVNITNITAMTGIADLGTFVNDASGGIFWGIILITLFIILVMNMLYQGIAKAVAAASLTTLFVSLPLFYLGFLHIIYVIVFAISLAGTLAFLWFEDRGTK